MHVHHNVSLHLRTGFHSTVTLELEFILRPTVSRPVRLGIGLPFGAHDQILSFSFFFSFDNYFVVLPRVPSLTRGRVCSLQCNR
jgi:hypothetical protein